MNEDDLSNRIVAHLNRGTEELPAQVLVKLRVAREAAMDRARERGSWSRNGSGLALVASRWFAMRMAIPVLFVLGGVSGVAYWQLSGPQQVDHAEIDAGLLSDELPITAYLDNGFDSWLEETAQD
jgi:hypothetical protein